MGTEKELIVTNNIQIHRLEKLYKENQELFMDLVDFIPLMITISYVKDWEFIFVNDKMQELANMDKEYILEKGVAYTATLVHPENLKYIRKVLDDFNQPEKIGCVQPYFQFVRGEKRKEHEWLLTYKKFLTPELYFSISHDLSELGRASKVLREYLGDLALSPEAYLRYQSLTIREKEILHLIAEGLSNEQMAERMFLSKNTIRTHRNRIWQKLEIRHYKDVLKYDLLFFNNNGNENG